MAVALRGAMLAACVLFPAQAPHVDSAFLANRVGRDPNLANGPARTVCAPGSKVRSVSLPS